MIPLHDEYQGLAVIPASAPAWLMGPANPIGGLVGWLGLTLLLLARRPWWNGARRGAEP